MIDLRTRWLGLDLRSPLVVGASPLTDDLEALARGRESREESVKMSLTARRDPGPSFED